MSNAYRGLRGRLAACISLVAGLAGMSGASVAAPVYLDPVTNVEWRQLTDTTGYSYNTMVFSSLSDACATDTGVCHGNLGGTGPSVEGWIWASENQVRQLFVNMMQIGGILPSAPHYAYTEPDSLWAPAAIDADGSGPDGGVFDATQIVAGQIAAILGMTRDLIGETNSLPGFPDIALIRDEFSTGGEDSVDTAYWAWTRDEPSANVGFWMFRAASGNPLPVPPTHLLIFAGLAGLAWRRRVNRVASA